MLRNVEFLIQLLSAQLLFALHMPKRKWFGLRFAVCAVMVFAIGFGLFFLTYVIHTKAVMIAVFLLTILGLVMLSSLVWAATLKVSVLHILFITIAGYATQHIFYNISDLLFTYTLSNVMNVVPLPVLRYTSMVIVYGCVYLFAGRKLRATTLDLNHKRFLFVATLVLITSVIISGLAGVLDAQITLKLYGIMCSFMVIYLLFRLISEQAIENKLKIIRSLQLKEKEQYRISEETIKLINVKCHDLRNQLSVLRKSSGEVDKSELARIEKAVSIYDSVVKTGNDALDVILTEKSLICENDGITLSCIIDGARMSFMSEIDIYSLFGNALDNAIEAVGQLEDVNQRRISIQVRDVGGMASVRIENKYKGERTMRKGMPVTTKPDTQYHGFGMLSISMIAEKYHGSVKVAAADGIFVLSLIFPPADKI